MLARLASRLALVALFTVGVSADIYMHNPRGSNNRLNEQSANRQNADRLFDSQNNNRGGYNVGDRSDNAFDASKGTQGVLSPADTYNTAKAVSGNADFNVQYQMVYYEGSQLSVEWTNQHGCGGNEATDPQKLNCDLILQYMCQTTDGTAVNGYLRTPTNTPTMSVAIIPGAEVLRDGATTNTPDTLTSLTDATTVGNNADKGHHESEMYYFECQTRSRNRGLFLADQTLNGASAQYTRQNPNGNRRGLECPEERDYYPYWSPSPWKDVVIMTDHVSEKCTQPAGVTTCDPHAAGYDPTTPCTFNGKSQNNNPVLKCIPADITAAGATAAIAAITPEDCAVAGGEPAQFYHRPPAPSCEQAQWSRVNHLGNGRFGQPLMYNWTLPTIESLINKDVDSGKSQIYTYADGTAQFAKCVARIRYNISTDDYDPKNTTSKNNQAQDKGVISPVTNNPTVDIGAGFDGVRLAVNTAQFGRTFQDRSHVFYIRTRPTNLQGKKIYNLNVRGKRGNIVQTYPSVEYDFQPARLSITPSDYVHVQWTGSNTHNNGDPGGDGQTGDAGEGRGGTDRHNIAQLMDYSQNYPIPLDKFVDNMWSRSTCLKLDGTLLSGGTTTAGDITQNSAGLDCSIYLTTVGKYKSAAEVVADNTNKDGSTNFDPLLNTSPASLVGGVVMQFNPVFPTGKTSTSYDYMCTRNNNFSNRGQKGTIEIHSP